MLTLKQQYDNAAIEHLTTHKAKVLITKHRNRKLYMSGLGAYLTLDQLDRLYRAGCAIEVRCGKLKSDITDEVLRSLVTHRLVSMPKDKVLTLLEKYT